MGALRGPLIFVVPLLLAGCGGSDDLSGVASESEDGDGGLVRNPDPDGGASNTDGGSPDAASTATLKVTLSTQALVVVLAGKGQLVGAEASEGVPPYTYAWRSGASATTVGTSASLDVGTLPTGDHEIFVEARDATGAFGSSAKVPVHVLPLRFDWSHQLRASAPPAAGNWMTPVKDQLACGSCWAYAALGVVEARYNIQKNDPTLDIDLSEQELIDCWNGAIGCGGGAPEQALDGYVRATGVPTEACRPTLGHDDTCKTTCTDGSTPARWKVKAFSFAPPATTVEERQLWMRDQIVHTGPMARAFEGMYDWNPSTFVCDGGQGSHFVVVVGYDDADGRWLLRNSWGPTWNGNGYFESKYGTCAVDAGGSFIGDVLPPP